MRIGVVTTSFPRFPGDPSGGFVAELCQWMEAQGHRVEVVAAGTPRLNERWQGLPITRLAAPEGLFYEGGAPDALRGVRRHCAAIAWAAGLVRELRTQAAHWDGIVAHWLAPSAIAAVLAAGNKPIWAIAHGGDVHLLARLGLTKLAAKMLDRQGLHLNFVSRNLQSLFADKAGARGERLIARSSVSSMGIDLEHFQSLRASSGAAASETASHTIEEAPLVLFLGRLIHLKGVDILLRALQGLDRNCRVVIAGRGPMLAPLQTLADDLGLDLEWAGEVHGAERDALLARAKVVVMPSRESQGRSEGMPMVALEALASGAQLIASTSGGLSEIPPSICHPVNPCNADTLRESLRQVLDDLPSNPAADESVSSADESISAAIRAEDWLAQRSWNCLAPTLLPGLSRTHPECRTA